MRAAGWIAAAVLAGTVAGAPARAEVALSPEQEARAHQLALSLRCPVCQNQTIAESGAPVAQDLREQVRAQVAAGRSDDEVRDFMRERFGDFVLYEPPWNAQTLALWLGPFALLGGGALALAWRLRRTARDAAGVDFGPDGPAAAEGAAARQGPAP